ncbi:MAG: tyrosine-type recombinase/integrase [Planctomycetota bacterium]
MGVVRRQGAWWIDWYEGGRRRRKKTAVSTKTEAKRLLEKVKAKMLPRELGLFDPKLSCAELVTRYLNALQGTRSRSTYTSAELSLRHFFTWCRAKTAAKLTPELAENFAAKRKKDNVSVRTINIELTNLKACLNWGVGNGLIPRNPLARLKRLKGESKGRTRFLSEDEIRRLLQAAKDTVYHDIFYVLIRTGMRKSELAHLRWEDIDFTHSLIRVGGHRDEHGTDDTKTHKERHLPMDTDLAEVIARQIRRRGCPHVFGTANGTVRANNFNRELKKHAGRAGIDDVTLHTLRHTFASHLVMNGTDLPSVKELLGHSNIQMTMRYSHLAKEHLRSAMENFKVPSYRNGPSVVAGPGFKRAAAK